MGRRRSVGGASSARGFLSARDRHSSGRKSLSRAKFPPRRDAFGDRDATDRGKQINQPVLHLMSRAIYSWSRWERCGAYTPIGDPGLSPQTGSHSVLISSFRVSRRGRLLDLAALKFRLYQRADEFSSRLFGRKDRFDPGYRAAWKASGNLLAGSIDLPSSHSWRSLQGRSRILLISTLDVYQISHKFTTSWRSSVGRASRTG